MNRNHQLSTQGADLRASNSAFEPTRSAVGTFVDWLLGTHSDKQEPAWPKLNEPQIVVASPSEHNSWVDSFNAALTEAATTFICRHVEPYHREDPTSGYAVTRVKVGIKDASAPCLRAIQSMPAGMRDRIVLLRIKKAKGSEQLMLDHFYGLSLLAEETLIDGQLVETLVSYSGSRFTLRFEFEGDYVDLPQVPGKPTTTPEADPKAGIQCYPTQMSTPAGSYFSGHKKVNDDSALQHKQTPTQEPFSISRDTPMHLPTAPLPSSGRDTPLYRPVKPLRSPLARLHLAARGANTVVELFEDGFPYAIGRHPDVPGFSVRSRNGALPGSSDAGLLAHTQTPETTCYVSRDHLVLNAPDLMSGEICIDNLSAQRGKNGTYFNGMAQTHRFIYALGAPHPLCLGGSAGDGILELRLEKA